MFGKGTTVKTHGGTVGEVVSEITHPVTRNTTAVIVQPTGTTSEDDRVVANPGTTRRHDG